MTTWARMKNFNGRLSKLEEMAGSGGQHTLTICYENDWQQPPREDIVMVRPALRRDEVLIISYVDDWRDNEGL